MSRQPDDSLRSVVVMGELRPRVLIVDDEPANVLLLKEFLTDTAGEFRLLTDSREVEQVFNEFKPDIVLLDLHMPNLDGHEILTRLQRARDAMGFVPFVILTSDTSTAARNTALVRGANFGNLATLIPHHLKNPFDQELVYLMGGENREIEVADFPRLGKRMVRSGEKIAIYDVSDAKPFGPLDT